MLHNTSSCHRECWIGCKSKKADAQSATALEAVKAQVKLQGPVTLGADPAHARTIATASASLDSLVWAANDTTGQTTAEQGRKGGRAVVSWTAADFTEAVELWSAEAPAVYCLVVQLVDAEGGDEAREGVEACQVAFRHSAIVDGELRHNGRPIMIRGVNRHEHDPITGKVRSCVAVHTSP